MKTLHNIFLSSRFYREARMVSFLDRLLQTITAKIKKRVSLAKAIKEAAQGPKSADAYMASQLASAMLAVQKFDEGFFIRELMKEKDSNTKVAEALGHSAETDEESKDPAMDQSFYRKQGIDFLSFQRPGTAYGSAAFQQAALSSTSTSFYNKGSLVKVH